MPPNKQVSSKRGISTQTKACITRRRKGNVHFTNQKTPSSVKEISETCMSEGNSTPSSAHRLAISSLTLAVPNRCTHHGHVVGFGEGVQAIPPLSVSVSPSAHCGPVRYRWSTRRRLRLCSTKVMSALYWPAREPLVSSPMLVVRT